MAEGSIKERRARRRKRKQEAREEVNEEVEETEKGITAKKGYATPSRRRGEDNTVAVQSNNPIVRGFRSVIDYFDGVRSELEKVTWPTREETIRLTWIVSGVTLASALFLGGLSILFTEIFNLGVDNPIVFIGVFVAFLGLIYAFSQYMSRSAGGA
ncbi:MAG: preprotein translocase subunit SecE [Chloroflexota bacterium]